MSANGQHDDAKIGQVLRWSGRVVTAQELQRQLNGHREVIVPARAIVTPSALDHLRSGGIRLSRDGADSSPRPQPTTHTWGFAQDRPHAEVKAAVQAVGREGIALKELTSQGNGDPCGWARGVAECIVRGECQGGVLFCNDAGLACCVANKVPGLRAVAVCTVTQAARGRRGLAANLAAVEMPGRTFFEIRQILRTLCNAATCPDGVAAKLRELDGHAHR